jgi:YbbR domain-containing protein
MRYNLGMKILAFVLAVTAWGFTRIADPIEEWQMVFDLDVRLSEGYALVSRFPNDRTITGYVVGQVSRLQRVQASNPRVVLDGRGLLPGEPRSVNLRLDRRFPGVNIELKPSSIDVKVDTYATSTFAPEEITNGRLPAGYYIDSRSGLPPEITVSGAKSLIDNISKVIYDLNLASLTGSTEISVDFKPIDADGNEIANLTLTPKSAGIGIGLQPSQALKSVPIVVDYQGNPASNFALTSLSSDPFLVEVAGPAEALSDIVSIRTEPLNLTGKTSSFDQSVRLINPNDKVSLSASQANVHVEIRQIDTALIFEDILIELRGANPNYDYSLNPDRVDITIRGGLSGISEASSDEVRPRIDLSGLEPGVHDIPVSVALPSGVSLDTVSPLQIEVTITVKGDTTDGQDNPTPTDGTG